MLERKMAQGKSNCFFIAVILYCLIHHPTVTSKPVFQLVGTGGKGIGREVNKWEKHIPLIHKDPRIRMLSTSNYICTKYMTLYDLKNQIYVKVYLVSVRLPLSNAWDLF